LTKLTKAPYTCCELFLPAYPSRIAAGGILSPVSFLALAAAAQLFLLMLLLLSCCSCCSCCCCCYCCAAAAAAAENDDTLWLLLAIIPRFLCWPANSLPEF